MIDTAQLKALKERAAQRVNTVAEALVDLSHWLSAHPELGLAEFESSKKLAETVTELTDREVQLGVGSLPTALLAEVGEGELVIAICAEYDALAGVGHACGHNIIASSAVGAFAALAPLADELDATIRLLGTPAEENDGGKVVMLREGAFDGVHAAMMIHPGGTDEVTMLPYACTNVYATFYGREAHASLEPFLGLNALDAATITLTAIGLARQQMRAGQQVHGIVTEGGTAPNVIPPKTQIEWNVRGFTLDDMWDVAKVVKRCAEGGAHASGCRVEVEVVEDAYADIVRDDQLLDFYAENARALGREPELSSSVGGSTDMGNVSQVIPSIHPMLGLGDAGLPIHTPDFATAARGPAGDRAVIDGAVLLAQTAIDACLDPDARARLIAHAYTAGE